MRYGKIAAFVAIVIALVVANYAFGWADWVVSGEFSALLSDLVNRDIVLAAVIYCAVSLAGCVALALPGVLFALAGGALFGPVLGTFLCWLSMSLGACISFLVGRYFLKDALKPKLAKSPLLNNLLFDGVEKSDVFLLAVTRLVPVFPFNLQNFAYGITDMRFIPYTVYSSLFIIPGTAAYVVGAAGVLDAENRVVCLVVAALLLAVSLLAAFLLKRKAGLS